MVLAHYDPLPSRGESDWKEGIESRTHNSVEAWLAEEADVYIYWGSSRSLRLHQDRLNQIEKPLLVGAVSVTLAELGWTGHPLRARFNHWADMRKGQRWEWSGSPTLLLHLEEALGIKGLTVPDQLGFLAPRVVAMIINEACYALAEGVSTEADINTAMRFGTNYPFGPFEWAERIGWNEVYDLLNALSKSQASYAPHPLIQTYLKD